MLGELTYNPLVTGLIPIRITSYINNLHPQKYQNLYSLIERVIDAAIPLWNLSLSRSDVEVQLGNTNLLQRIFY